jgi:hypothetical protein
MRTDKKGKFICLLLENGQRYIKKNPTDLDSAGQKQFS